MIRLLVETFEDGTESPISLEINDKTYVHTEDALFEKLENHIDQEITIIKSGFYNNSKNYIIESIDLNSVNLPILNLKDINESTI